MFRLFTILTFETFIFFLSILSYSSNTYLLVTSNPEVTSINCLVLTLSQYFYK